LGQNNRLDNKDLYIGAHKSSEKILDAIKKNPNATLAEMADSIGLSVAGVRKNLDKLREAGTIRRFGPDKSGHWGVIKNKPGMK